MAWSVLQSWAGTVNSGAVLSAAPTTANLTSGSKIIAVTTVDTSTANSVTSFDDGNSNAGAQVDHYDWSLTGRGDFSDIWVMDTPAGDVGTKPTFNLHFSNAFTVTPAVFLEVTGLATGQTASACLDTSSTAVGHSTGGNAGVASPFGPPTYTSSASNEFLLYWVGDPFNGFTTWSGPAGYTIVTDDAGGATFGSIMVGYKNSTGAAETGAWSWTGGASYNGSLTLVAFKLASVAAVTYVAPRTLPAQTAQYHAYLQRSARVDQSTAANPWDPTVGGISARYQQAAYADRRAVPQQRTYIDPNEFSGGGGTNLDPTLAGLRQWQTNQAAELADRQRHSEFWQTPHISDPSFYPVDGTGVPQGFVWWSADMFGHQYLQRPLVSDPNLLLTALLEGPLLGIPPKTPWRRDPYWVPPGERGVDPNLLNTALLEGPLLCIGPKIPWRRDPYWIPARPYSFDPNELLPAGQFDPTQSGIAAQYKVMPVPPPWIPFYNQHDLRDANTVATPANPLPSPLDSAWQAEGVYWHLYNDWRPRPPGPIQARPYAYDPNELVGPTNFDPTQAGLPAQGYWVWRRDPYWTPPQREPGWDPFLLTTALLEGPLLGIGPKTPWRRDPYWTPARAYAFDPNELVGPSNFDPTQAGLAAQAYWVWRRDPYWVPPGERGVDPFLLTQALLEDVLLFAGAPKTPWRRDPNWVAVRPYAYDPNELVPPAPFDPTLSGINWTRINALFNVRPDAVQYWQRVLISDPSFYPSFIPPTLAGLVSPGSLAGKFQAFVLGVFGSGSFGGGYFGGGGTGAVADPSGVVDPQEMGGKS